MPPERSQPSNTQSRSTGNNLNTANITPPWPAYLTQLFEEVRKGNTKRSNVFDQELETVRKIVNITRGVKLLRHEGECYAVRVLHFLSEVAVLEQRGLSTGPATLYGLIMESLHILNDEFYRSMASASARPIGFRTQHKNTIQKAVRDWLDGLKTGVKDAKLHLGLMSKLQRMAQETPQERPPSLLPNLVKRNLHGHVESTGINLMHAAVMSPIMTTSFPKPEPSLALYSMLQGFYSDQSSPFSINSRTDPHQLAFRSPEHLLQWRVTASSRAMMLSRLEDQIVHLPLTGFCAAWLPHVVDLFQSDSQPAAAYVLELIAALLRDELERKYSHKLLLSLCHALGALSIVSREDGEIKKAIATASYAIKLLQPSLEKDSKRRIPIMANLKLEHAHALSQVPDLFLRDADDAASEAVSLFRRAVKANSADKHAKLGLARACLLHCSIIVRMDVVDTITHEPIHVAIDTLRPLVRSEPRLYEVQLISAFEIAGKMHMQKPELGIPYFEEALSICEQREKACGHRALSTAWNFAGKLAQFYNLAGFYEKTLALATANVELWAKIFDLDTDSLRARAMSKLRLEMYAGAIDDARTAEEKFCASLPPGRMPNAARTVVAELKAIQGFSQSMIGQDIKKARENLEGAIKLIEGSAISFAPEDPFETRECAAALSWLAGFSCAAGEKKTALFQAQEAVNIMRARIWGREEEENSDCEDLDIDKSTSDYEVLEYARTLLVLSAVLAANGKKKKAKARIEACWKWVQGRKVEDSTLKTILLLRAHILDLIGTTSQAEILRNQASRIGKAGYFDKLVRCNGA